jgi:hypothetical protein
MEQIDKDIQYLLNKYDSKDIVVWNRKGEWLASHKEDTDYRRIVRMIECREQNIKFKEYPLQDWLDGTVG